MTKAPELTAAQVTKLMTLYYVDVKQKFTARGTSSTNVAVWESLTAMFNSWCDPFQLSKLCARPTGTGL